MWRPVPIDKVRIGIDVGGTFTHAVALNAETVEIIGKSKVPTTHWEPEGVARGIIDALRILLKEARITPERVAFIAHSTTQATNALLEGDVAPVGVLGMGAAPNAWIAKFATNLGQIELAPEKFLVTYHEFLDISTKPSDGIIRDALEKLVLKGAKAIAISQAFAVDEPEEEQRALKLAREMNLLATSGSEVSQLYGLKVRTRTAAINASILPKMIESANMTERSVREAGINAPVMVMRSDGGVMDIEAMRKKPIQTMLSGPAAGVAAAMMFLHVCDGIFLEVGGTSTDISAISNGRARIRSGEIGGQRVYMRTLDVRTVGVAGGSMPRLNGMDFADVGPRSAHIARLQYVSFAERLTKPEMKLIKPLKQDPDDYLAIADGREDASLAVTPTCAANLLGLVPTGDYAAGNKELVRKAFQQIADQVGGSAEDIAENMLEISASKIIPIVKALIHDHKLDTTMVSLVGGGGGAAALVPFVAKQMGMKYELAAHADVISAIGVALALIRETVERQFLSPTNEDLLRVREQAFNAVQKMGADPASIEIHIEVDSRTNTIRATASGATGLASALNLQIKLPQDERLKLVAESMRVDEKSVSIIAENEYFQVYAAHWTESKVFGLIKNECRALRVLDAQGRIRLQIKNGIGVLTNQNSANKDIAQLLEEHAHWGDAGRVIPDTMLLAGPKILDLSGLPDIGPILALANTELENQPKDAKVILIVKS